MASELQQFRIALQKLGAFPAKDKIDYLTLLAKTMTHVAASDAINFIVQVRCWFHLSRRS
jgi:hypothetical protein